MFKRPLDVATAVGMVTEKAWDLDLGVKRE